MKLSIATFFILVLFPGFLFAQNENATLLVQSPDGKNVKLIWFFKSWSSDITGFDIKRKDGLQDWVKLNPEPILPAVSAKKKLSVVESDKTKESMVRVRLLRLLNSHKLQETDNSAYLQRLNGGDKAVQEIMNNLLRDYDIALMSGFAYDDHAVTKKTNYQYGLFIQGTNRLLATANWNYGEIPDLNAVTEITSKATQREKGILVMWSADLTRSKAGKVAGFNIYREGIRLNLTPIVAQNQEQAEYSWYDRSAFGNIPNQYSISAESIFGIEGIIKPYTYNPADHPNEYKVAEVSQINSMGYYFKEGINVKWGFPKDYERFVKGFYVEKDNLPGRYQRVSGLLDPTARTFIDKTPSPITGYIKFRVVAVYMDKTNAPGVEKLYNYFPVREPPPPQNVKAKSAFSDKKATVTLSWDAPLQGDSATDYFRIYLLDTVHGSFNAVSGNEVVRTSKYSYVIRGGVAALYRFGISAIGKNNTESPLSDTVSLMVPSLELPVPAINKVSVDSNRAMVSWQYPWVPDLKGFRLYQNNTLIAGENELTADSREFTANGLEAGLVYSYTLRAVSDNGVTSEASMPQSTTIAAPPLKK